MAATTLSAILARVKAVLEAAPLSLEPAGDPFTDTGTSNLMVDRTFRVVAGGLLGDTQQSNYSVARLERITVTVARKLNFDGYGAQEDLSDQFDAIERAIIDDGPDHSYDATVEKGSRKVVRPKDTDICQGSVSFIVDYDYSLTA